MADCHANFAAFNACITPSTTRRRALVEHRNQVREAVRQVLSDARLRLDLEFRPQGSFRLGTAVERPACDIDDGLFFSAADFGPQQPSVELLFDLVHRALKSRGYFCYKRNPCIRLVFAAGLRMDLVLFLKRSDGTYYAHRADGLVKTDPLFLIHWFERRMDADGQLRRLVKYAKVWLDNRPSKMPSGVVMTILMAQNHVRASRDDVAFIETLKAIRRSLSSEFICRRPTPPVGEDLLCDELNRQQQNWFDQTIADAIHLGAAAIDAAASDILAVDVWRTVFGTRFPAVPAHGACVTEHAAREAILHVLCPPTARIPDVGLRTPARAGNRSAIGYDGSTEASGWAAARRGFDSAFVESPDRPVMPAAVPGLRHTLARPASGEPPESSSDPGPASARLCFRC